MSGLGKETLNDQNHLDRCTSDVRRRNPWDIVFRDQMTIAPVGLAAVGAAHASRYRTLQ